MTPVFPPNMRWRRKGRIGEAADCDGDPFRLLLGSQKTLEPQPGQKWKVTWWPLRADRL